MILNSKSYYQNLMPYAKRGEIIYSDTLFSKQGETIVKSECLSSMALTITVVIFKGEPLASGMSDVDALTELLTLIDQEADGDQLQPLATTGLSAVDGDDGDALLRADDLVPDVFSGPLAELLVDDNHLSTDDNHLSTGDNEAAQVADSNANSEREIVEALVLTQEERDELLSALTGEDDNDECGEGPDLGLRVLPAALTDKAGSDVGANNNDRGSSSHSDESSEAASQPQQQQPKVKKPRRRKRQKDEMNYLEYRVRHLEAQLERLQLQERKFAEETLAAATKFNLLPGSDVLASGSDNNRWLSTMLNGPRSQLWQRVAHIEREESRTAVLENIRLRAQYESQLQVAKRLEALYHNQLSFAVRVFSALFLLRFMLCAELIVISQSLWLLRMIPRSWTLCLNAASSASALAWTRSATTQWCSPRSVATLTHSTHKRT